ncbi:MAG: hypothetical protein ACI4MJ_04200 [Aristaeellaceae bacterium]
MKHGKGCLCALMLSMLLMLPGCTLRTRIIPADDAAQAAVQNTSGSSLPAGEQAADAWTGIPFALSGENRDAPSDEPDPNAPSVHDPNVRRREYHEHADAELVEGDNNPLWLAAQDASTHAAEGKAGQSGMEADSADLKATEMLSQQEAEQLGVSEEAPRAEQVYQFYQTLLNERVGSLFECKRLYVYWETSVDYQTVFKTSPEHQVILMAGGYDVAAKRQADALLVDDGWIARKTPGCIVKCVDSSVLGKRVRGIQEAQRRLDALCARPGWQAMNAVKTKTVILLSEELMVTQWGQLAAALYLAQIMYPDAMSDVDTDEALRLLSQEATGTAINGVFAYAQQEVH